MKTQIKKCMLKSVRKNQLLLMVLLWSAAITAQVGVGTTTPSANLDIPATNAVAPSNTDGILIPRIHTFPAVNPTAAQNGMMVFLTTVSGANQPGFYYWDQPSASWKGISGTKGWELTGNAGTIAGTNFIGTTDAVDVIFKRNNVQSGRLSGVATSFGVGALNPISSGVYNTAIGASAMQNNTSGHSNTTVGSYAMYTNTDGVRNTAVGTNAMYYNQNGQKNTAMGNNAGNANTTGSSNTAVGNDALTINQTGSNNTAIGNESGNLITGSGNLTIGANTNVPNPAGSHQMNIGQVIYGEGINITSFAKIGIGEPAPKAKLHMGNAANPAMPTNADGIIISRVNNFCAPASMTADQNGMMVFLTTAVGGNQPGFYYWDHPSTSWKSVGSGNVGWALNGNTGTNPAVNFIGTTDFTDVIFKRDNLRAGLIGQLDTSFGSEALNPLSTGGFNSAFGEQALQHNTSGFENTAIGAASLWQNLDGFRNLAAGLSAMSENLSGNYNTAIGNSAMSQKLSGDFNTAVGYESLQQNFTGNSNTAIGYQAGLTTTGSGNISIGALASVPVSSGNDQLSIGNVIYGTTMSTTALGKIGIGEIAPSAKLQISSATPATPANTDGIIIPRVNIFPVTNPTAAQNGMMVFLTTAVGLNQPGFYYWDNPSTSWKGVGSESGWSINGNSNITVAKFIGTTTNSDVRFRRNNVPSGIISSNNTSFGNGSMGASVTGNFNAAFGNNTMTVSTSGFNNSAFGDGALKFVTSGGYNSAFGSDAMRDNDTGSDNFAMGYFALPQNKSASKNIAIGSNAMNGQNFANGGTPYDTNNIAIGYQAMYGTNPTSLTNGKNNVAIGTQSMKFNTVGSNNTAVGNMAMIAGSANDDNTAVGYYALAGSTNGKNTAVGSRALYTNSNLGFGEGNTAVGYNAISSSYGSFSTAVGAEAMPYATGTGNTAIGARAIGSNALGSGLTAVGYKSLFGNKSASNNVGLGYESLMSNTYGAKNIAVGTSALYTQSYANANTAWDTNNIGVGFESLYTNNPTSNTNGMDNIGMGSRTLRGNTTGSRNIAVGTLALNANTTGDQNTAIGNAAMSANVNGADNVAVGRNALLNQIGGNNNTCIGNYVYPTSGTSVSNYTGIGYNVGGGGSLSNMVELGNGSVTAIRAQVTGITAYSDRRIKNNIQENVPGLEFISKLRPVTYNIDLHKQNEIIYRNKTGADADWDGKYDIEKIKQTGFIAQEVAQAAQAANYEFNGVDVPKNPEDLYSVNYTSFVVPLVKAIQEQQQQIESLKTQLDAQQQINQELMKRLEKLEQLGK